MTAEKFTSLMERNAELEAERNAAADELERGERHHAAMSRIFQSEQEQASQDYADLLKDYRALRTVAQDVVDALKEIGVDAYKLESALEDNRLAYEETRQMSCFPRQSGCPEA
jgi:hypothetical protein